MREEEKEGEEAAQRLVLEMQGEDLAKKIMDDEAREHAKDVERKVRGWGGGGGGGGGGRQRAKRVAARFFVACLSRASIH